VKPLCSFLPDDGPRHRRAGPRWAVRSPPFHIHTLKKHLLFLRTDLAACASPIVVLHCAESGRYYEARDSGGRASHEKRFTTPARVTSECTRELGIDGRSAIDEVFRLGGFSRLKGILSVTAAARESIADAETREQCPTVCIQFAMI
jgi:hypothetical protein